MASAKFLLAAPYGHMAQYVTMNTPESAREYLRRSLPGGELKSLSEGLRRNHAYLHQYISRGKPLWLSERDRTALCRLRPDLDPEKLKPPPLDLNQNASHQRRDKAHIEAPSGNQIGDDPRTLQSQLSL